MLSRAIPGGVLGVLIVIHHRSRMIIEVFAHLQSWGGARRVFTDQAGIFSPSVKGGEVLGESHEGWATSY